MEDIQERSVSNRIADFHKPVGELRPELLFPLFLSFNSLRDLAFDPFPVLFTRLSLVFPGELEVGRTIPSWRIIVEQRIAELTRFNQFLRPEDRVVFDDLLKQCKFYASQAGVLASPVEEVPLLLSMVFAQRKRLTELERQLSELLNLLR
jgi:hypothetical protein